MTPQSSQGFWAPGGATVRVPLLMRLAPADRERLWKGLERFVNCDDSVGQFEALGRAFVSFWPIRASYFIDGNSMTPATRNIGVFEAVQRLDWDPACHSLFLFYRDTLRTLWRGGREPTRYSFQWEPKFLLGIDESNKRALQEARNHNSPIDAALYSELVQSWEEILQKFPTARIAEDNHFEMIWGYGDFFFLPWNDFGRAFYLLFRQSWRARICLRCKMFFVARRPKQKFCGTVCSAGSRLASKRKWWHSVGTKNRKKAAQLRNKRGK